MLFYLSCESGFQIQVQHLESAEGRRAEKIGGLKEQETGNPCSIDFSTANRYL
jgi:hypothetical protein